MLLYSLVWTNTGISFIFLTVNLSGVVVKSAMCLTANPEVASLIPARFHTFVEIDHEIISTAILLPSADSRRVVVSYKRKYVHEVLVNCLVKLAQEKSVVRLTDLPDMVIAVDLDIKQQTRPKTVNLFCNFTLMVCVSHMGDKSRI